MTKATHVLELNGRRYDAMSGKALDGSAHKPVVRSLDGFVKPSAKPQPQAHHRSAPATAHHARASIAHRVSVPHASPHPSHTAQAAHTPPAKGMDVHRSSTHHARPHQMQHSQTLMRQAVRRPEASLMWHARPMQHTGTLVKAPRFDIAPKYSVNSVDQSRLKRARSVERSRFISRFAVSRTVSQPVRAATSPLNSTARTPFPFAAQVQIPAREPSTDIFERALAAANSHKEPYAPVKHRAKKSHRVRRVASMAASTLAVLLIAGFVAYQNATTIQLRVASSRSGVNATLPTWQPGGFRLGTFAYQPGTVTMDYKDVVSGRSYSITQTASNWNSDTLLSEYVYPHNESYDTISANGSTIYMYGKNNATWVNGGIWYRLTTDGSLSTSQIVNIATSMQS